MAEDEGEQGRIAHERLIVLLEELGWNQRGKKSVDISCSSGLHPDRTKHGVDSYFSYDGPFRDLERGVFVESKSSQWSKINGSKIDDDMKQLIKTVECAPEADDFDEKLNGNTERIANAGALAIWSTDDFYSSDFNSYIQEVGVRAKPRGTYEIVVLGNERLNQLSMFANKYREIQSRFNGEEERVYVYYPSTADNPFPSKRPFVTLEYLVSDFILTRVETLSDGDNPSGKQISNIFYFGKMNGPSLEVLFQCMIEYNLLEDDEINIYYDGKNTLPQDIESAKRYFGTNIVDEDKIERRYDAVPQFDFSRLQDISYESFTEGLRRQ